jgi:hypothetical protein
MLLLGQSVGKPTQAADWLSNPFAKESGSAAKKSAVKKASEKKRSGGSPVRSTASSVHRPSLWQRMGTGTRRFLGSTWDTLTFQKKQQARQPVSGETRTWSGNKAQQPKKESWLSSWFGRKEPEPPETIGEWMSLERPGY